MLILVPDETREKLIVKSVKNNYASNNITEISNIIIVYYAMFTYSMTFGRTVDLFPDAEKNTISIMKKILDREDINVINEIIDAEQDYIESILKWIISENESK